MKFRSASSRPLLVAAAALLPVVAGIHAASLPVESAPAPIPLRATRFVSVGAGASDSLSIATDRCVLRIRQRHPGALPACKLAAHRARLGPLEPRTPSFVSNAARRDYAYALGNYAIAQVLAGDSKAAQATTVLALEYLPGDPTLVANLAALEGRRLAANPAVRAVN